jgi:subtilisin-like proprotein convertase family protein
LAAAQAAVALSDLPEIEVAVPVMRRSLHLHEDFVARPNDPYFTDQWHLENRNAQGVPQGPDLNPRGAWGVSRGASVIIGVADDGFETDHPDLVAATANAPHFDFVLNLAQTGVYGSHATCVAGLAAARGGNALGVSGVAPAARLANWPIFDLFGNIVSDERLMDMFQYRIQQVAVQNHSWGNADASQSGPSALEAAGIDQALTLGRNGRGVVMVRSGGNGRDAGFNVNDDGYPNDPRVIAVAAARKDGRTASYSSPGACILVAAPSGDDRDTFEPTINLYSTDRVGNRGYNPISFTNDLANYAFLAFGFSGTSGSAPMISGLAALILDTNPRLTARDVQQVILHAARHHNPADPTLQTNAAGYVVSHDQGFGIPDAAQAVQLARSWSNRPPLVIHSIPETTSVDIPDDGLKAWISGPGEEPFPYPCQPALGPHPDDPTRTLPLVFVGLATNAIAVNLTGKAALIQRGVSFFRDKIQFAADAGAEFVVIFNNTGGEDRFIPGGTDFVPLPAVMLSENDGLSLVQRIEQGETLTAQLRLEQVQHTFSVTTNLLAEHVGLRVHSNHSRRGDVRITLTSPSGTRSVLQRYNQDFGPGPFDWTYWSVQHFGEPVAGTWTAHYSDEDIDQVGSILEAELILRGVPITDTDNNGLDDNWERHWFSQIGQDARSDDDRDGRTLAQEQWLGTDPTRPQSEFRLATHPYDAQRNRLSWPHRPGESYAVQSSSSVDGSLEEIARVRPTGPEAEYLVPRSPDPGRFYRIEAIPEP